MAQNEMGSPELHFWLTRSVARVMGVNLSEAMASDRITAQDYASLVTACRECALVENCKCWLGEQLALTSTAPPGCANTKTLESLARHH
ncbi:DUF6455 family protein [Marivita geojedonensis]|uniref:DUF6455 domain-containing protein n=1 Tax=Marivita geojedonensis TaxID=1123756 RepID=A0A1X4NDH5_9RHOB|nr:DUF6455 family protein [Marivita geojedonensis]OSQ44945.1 hypothetical protein MGEO_18565 [Marivita geojedonensis]PRY73838.1 hypothetical protein CLV76_12716 [Marivita geojedonensis]